MIKKLSSFLVFPRRNYKVILDGHIDTNSTLYQTSISKYDLLSKELQSVKLKFLDGGGERSRVKHVRNKKKLIEERLAILFDDNTYEELGFFVGLSQSYGDIPRAGCVSAIGKINGRYCAAMASDATVKAGTIYPIQLRKQMRLYELTEKLRLPFIFIVDSGGAFLPLQSEIFPDKEHGGRVFYYLAHLQSLGLPVVTLVCGSCTAGAAYIPTMSSETGVVHGTGHIFLGGPPLVKAAIGETVTAEELGGATLHASVSGCSDYKFESEDMGLATLRDVVETLPLQRTWRDNDPSCEPLYPASQLDGLLINDADCTIIERARIMEQILSRLVDSSTVHKFKMDFGTGLITGFARIDGAMVGVLAAYDALTEADCAKAAHFVQLCNQRLLPLVSLVHTIDQHCAASANPASPCAEPAEQGQLLKAKANLVRAMSTRKTALITVVVGDAIEFDSVCLGGECLHSEMILAWPNARFMHDQADKDEPEFVSALTAAGFMLVDDVIVPSETRKKVAQFLHILNTNTNLSPDSAGLPVFRF